MKNKSIIKYFKALLVKYLLLILNRKGFEIIRTKDLKEITSHYWKVIIEMKNSKNVDKIDSIVFSKDRALQLYAFLESYYEMVTNHGRMYILFKATNDRHKKSYIELQNLFKFKDCVFIEEIDFRQQLLEICENSNAKMIGLYVDDMIFLIKVDYQKILNLDLQECVVALSRGKDLDQHPGRELILPEFTKRADGFESFRWDYSNSFSHWTYPVGVSGYFYYKDEWNVMLRNTLFRAPNSLEGSLQKFVPLFMQREGICLDQIACVCVHANLVQTEWDNPILGTFSIDELLEKWEKGLCIDISKFYNSPGMDAKYQTYEFKNR